MIVCFVITHNIYYSFISSIQNKLAQSITGILFLDQNFNLQNMFHFSLKDFFNQT